jgi:hypothetical protein
MKRVRLPPKLMKTTIGLESVMKPLQSICPKSSCRACVRWIIQDSQNNLHPAVMMSVPLFLKFDAESKFLPLNAAPPPLLSAGDAATVTDNDFPSTVNQAPLPSSPAPLPLTFQTLQGLNLNHLSFFKPLPVRVRS